MKDYSDVLKYFDSLKIQALSNSLFCSCGFLSPSTVCGILLQKKKVYFDDVDKQNEQESRIHQALSRFNLSADCYKMATAALCYHTFPSCSKRNAKKHRLCKEDCLTVKKTLCKNQLPKIFPVCSDLPKREGRRGKHCKSLIANKGRILRSY